jgi:hypothetical protein
MPTQYIKGFLSEKNIWNACYLSSILKSANPLSFAIFDPYINLLFIYEILVRAQNYLSIILILFLIIASWSSFARHVHVMFNSHPFILYLYLYLFQLNSNFNVSCINHP